MDVKELLHNAGITPQDEAEINQFLSLRQKDIEDILRTWWDEYKQSVLPESGLPPVDAGHSSGLPPEAGQVEVIEKTTDITPDTKQMATDTEKNKERDSLSGGKVLILPNGKVNQDYHFILDISRLGFPDVAEISFIGLDELGLHYSPGTSEISGKPQKPGDYKVELHCKSSTAGRPELIRTVTLIVNPDPKSLWNNIPTPTDCPYYKPDEASEFITIPATGFIRKQVRKDMVVASQRGRSHAHEGRARDDDYGLSYIQESEWYVMVVADGAGSAKFSRKGSQIACETVVQACGLKLKDDFKKFDALIAIFQKDHSDVNRKQLGDSLYGIVGGAVFNAYRNIVQEAQEAGNVVKDYATTLLVCICKKFKFGWFVGSFWVGDGGIGIYGKDSRYLKILGEPDGGEFAGQTRFLTMPEITQSAELFKRLRFDIVDDFTALVLMTDGVTDPKFETDANLSRIEKWDELWDDLSGSVDFKDDNEEAREQLLRWLDFWSPGNHDDRTIAILY